MGCEKENCNCSCSDRAKEHYEDLMFQHYTGLFLNGEDVINQVSQSNKDAIVLEPRKTMNCAIVGFDSDNRIIYSYNKVIEMFMHFDKMSEEEAREHFDYNVLGTFDGMQSNNKPIFMYEN
jgi:hypothetical protein